jgi:hypothetical protein
MKTTISLTVMAMFCGLPGLASLPLTESTFTEIIQDVNVVAAADKTVPPARTNELFKAPDLVRTGQLSRVELTAKDLTITRIGANTTFTFEPGGRDIQLKKGSVLFHSPAGAGGGAIKNRGSSAAVLGTTEIGAVLPDGRFKVLDLEGSVKVTLVNGLSITLKPGQMVIISADGNEMGDVMNFNLGELASRLQLAVGFSRSLSSWALIEAAVQQQNRDIAEGKLGSLVSLEIAGFGLDIRYRGLDDLPFYSFNALGDGNPLDFPGMGPVGPMPHGPGGFPLLPAGGFPLIINPPTVTEVDPH